MVYKEGLNTDPLPFNPKGDCEPGGIYFSREDILAFMEYGEDLYEVEPFGEVYENPYDPKKWKAHEVKLKYIGKSSDPVVIQMLLDDGARIDAGYGDALSSAVGSGSLEVTKLLLARGADYTIRALAQAAWHGQLEAVEVLLDAGVNPSSNFSEALENAALNHHISTVKLLLERGADVSEIISLKELLSDKGHSRVIQLLEEALIGGK